MGYVGWSRGPGGRDFSCLPGVMGTQPRGGSLEWKGAEAGRERPRWDHGQDVNVRMRKEAEVGD